MTVSATGRGSSCRAARRRPSSPPPDNGCGSSTRAIRPSPHDLLEALWLFQSHNVVEPDLLNRVLHSPSDKARAAAVRVCAYWQDRLPNVLDLLRPAAEDESPLVRLMADPARRTPAPRRPEPCPKGSAAASQRSESTTLWLWNSHRRFEQVMRTVGIPIAFRFWHPAPGRGDHGLRVAARQLDPAATRTRSSGSFNRSSSSSIGSPAMWGGFSSGRPGLRDAIDAAMHAVAVRIPQVVLHVADDRVVPVGEVDAPSGPISRSAGRKFGSDEKTIGSTSVRAEARAFVEHLVLQDSLEADDVGDQQIPLQLVGEMAAGQELDPGTGSRPLLVDGRRLRRASAGRSSWLENSGA